MPPLSDIRDLIERSHRVLIASHVDPDGDAIGSQLAFATYLRQLGKEVFMVRDSEVPAKYRFLDGVGAIAHVDSFPDEFAVDTAVILECPTLERIGRGGRWLTGDVKIVNIDHHYESGDFGTVNWIDPTKSSVGEMLFELFDAMGYDMPPEVAEHLFTAIMTDTGRFRYQGTSPRTMEIAGRLIAAGAQPKKITDHVYYRLPASTMKLTGMVMATLEYAADNAVCILTLTNKMLAEAGAESSESDGLVDFTLSTDGVEIGVLLKEQDENSTRVSLRSRDRVNVAELAGVYGGGGHYNASGCTVPMGLAEAKKELIGLMTDALKKKTGN